MAWKTNFLLPGVLPIKSVGNADPIWVDLIDLGFSDLPNSRIHLFPETRSNAMARAWKYRGFQTLTLTGSVSLSSRMFRTGDINSAVEADCRTSPVDFSSSDSISVPTSLALSKWSEAGIAAAAPTGPAYDSIGANTSGNVITAGFTEAGGIGLDLLMADISESFPLTSRALYLGSPVHIYDWGLGFSEITDWEVLVTSSAYANMGCCRYYDAGVWRYPVVFFTALQFQIRAVDLGSVGPYGINPYNDGQQFPLEIANMISGNSAASDGSLSLGSIGTTGMTNNSSPYNGFYPAFSGVGMVIDDPFYWGAPADL